jgi:methionine sulfoxide reductase heme-binding subunit
MPRPLNPSMKLLKPPVFALALVPLAVLLMQGLSGQINTGPVLARFGLDQDLGANPVEFVQHATGNCILVFLCLTLAITPLRKISGQAWLIKFRRMLGLFAFFYACLHFLTYLWPDQQFSLAGMMKDVVKRPFITAGFTGFVLLTPLALTSTAWAIRRLGGKDWQRLHRLVYLAAVAGVVHYYWLVKSDVRMPLLYGAIVAVLLGYRVALALRRRSGTTKTAPAQAVTAENA